jgi:hypothetical protein
MFALVDIITGPHIFNPMFWAIVKMAILIVVMLTQRWGSWCELWKGER